MKPNETFQVIAAYLKSKGIEYDAKNPSHHIQLKRNLRAARDLLSCTEGDVEGAITAIQNISRWARSNNLSYSLETVSKRFLDDNTPTQRPYIMEQGKRYELQNRNGEWKVLDRGKLYNYSGKKSNIQYDDV